MPTNEQRREAAKRKLDRQLARRAQRARRRRRYAVVGSVSTIVLVAGLIVMVTVLAGGEDEVTAEPSVPPLQPTPTSEPPAIPTEVLPVPTRPVPLPATVDCQYPASQQPAAKPVPAPPAGPVSAEGTQPATLQTSAGPIPITLHRPLAPCTVHSFTHLAQHGFYANSPCHRLVTGPSLQVLQCGDPTGQGTGGPGYTVPDEFFPELTYGRGYVAMANTGQPNSGGSQFFLIYGYAQLPPSYTVFATISEEGLAVIDEIARAGDDASLEPSPGGGKPNTPITITSVELPAA